MGGVYSRELQLAQHLRELCNGDGKEIHPQKSAEVLHKFGLLYQGKSPDKISLIQSAAFLNAAIVRQEQCLQFKQDLQSLCSHVLEAAGAENQEADLIQISAEVLNKVVQMRNRTKELLKNIKPIPYGLPKEKLHQEEIVKISLVRKLQNKITDNYSEIMYFVSKKCCDIMGPSPCKYSVTGMGSLARKEITPFSDFEHVIILEEGVQAHKDYEEKLEYFRWFSVIFHIIIINLKETILRSVAVPLLNDDSFDGGDWFFDDHTPCGIKFDGMQLHACKFPLGRTRTTESKPFTVELIKPVSEMVNFLEREEALKNGYHLADMLTKTCFVSGYEDVHNQFQALVDHVLSDELFYRSHIEQILSEVRENLDSFDSYNDMANMNTASFCNIKRVVYRTTTLFLSALARFQSINKSSCFDIVDSLLERELISIEAAHKLSTAVAVACECRLKVYMLKGGQDDFVGERDYDIDDKKTLNKLTEILGEQSLGDYFEIAYSLQNALKNGSFKDLKKLQCSVVQKVGICWFLNLRKRLLHEWETFAKVDDTTNKCDEDSAYITYMAAQMYVRDNEFQKALELFTFLEEHASDSAGTKLPSPKPLVMGHKARCLFYLQQYSEAMTYIEQAKAKVRKISMPPDMMCDVLCNMASLLGYCKQHFKQFEEAVTAFKEALYYCRFSKDPTKDGFAVFCYCNCGRCYMKLGKLKEAIAILNEAVNHFHKSSVQATFMCDCYQLLGECYMRMDEHAAAFQQLVMELQIRQQYVPEDLHGLDKEILLCRKRIDTLSTLL